MSLSLGNVKLKCPACSIQSRPTTEKSSLPGNQIVVWIAGTLFKIQAVKKQILYLCLKVYVITRGEIHQFSSYDWMHWFICRVNWMALCCDHCPAPFSCAWRGRLRFDIFKILKINFYLLWLKTCLKLDYKLKSRALWI